MATLQKRGKSYCIRTYVGYDIEGKQIERTTTWTPPDGMTERQAEKEATRQAVLFEERIRNGEACNGKIKFADFAEQWLSTYARPQLRPRTVARYEKLLELQDRINDPDISLTLQPEALATLGAELKLEYHVNIQPAEAPLPEILWESDNPDVVTVKDGTIYAAGVGSAVITASYGGVQATCSVRVSIPLQEIQFDWQAASIAVGETLQMVAKPVPEDATDFSVTWSSEDSKIASVSEDGIVTSVAPGTVIITANCGEISVQCGITVGYHAEVVQLDRQDIALAIGQTYKLVPTIYPSADMIDTLYFESSNSKVVTVSSDGTVAALAAGKAYITFRCGEATAKCLVTVTAAEAQP